jgi:6-phosphogluconolactonase
VPERRLLIGTYTSGRSAQGLYTVRLDDGDAAHVVACAPLADPSFVARHPDGTQGYVVNELPNATGTVTRIGIDAASGRTTPLETVSADGRLPCHLALTRDAKYLWVACYGTGTVSVLRLSADGAFTGAPEVIRHTGRSVHPRRQLAPHAHCISMHPNARDVYVTDLGTDRIEHYRPGHGGRIEKLDGAGVTPGSGPRHLTFSRDGRRAFLCNEIDNTLDVFDVRPDGALRHTGRRSTLPPDSDVRSYASEVVLSADERTLYVGNRGHDSIGCLSVDGTRADTWIDTRGSHPRHFALSPDGTRLAIANRDSDNLIVYRLGADGRPADAPPVVSALPAPAFVLWL